MMEIQREIVARIESERAIVHGNRELILLYEEKAYAGVLSMPRGFNAQKGDSNG